MRTVWDIIVGGGCSTRTASSDGLSAAHARGDRVSASLLVVCGLWGTYASLVARHNARGEFWAAGASDGGLFDGADWYQSPRGARNSGDAVSDRGECGQYYGVGAGSEYRARATGGGGAAVRA